MASTLFGMTSYYGLYKSPVSSYQVSPLTNLIFNSEMSKAYAKSAGKTLNNSMSSYLSSLSSISNELKTTAKALTDKGADASFNQKSVTSSDNSAVSGKASPNADPANYTVKVSSLATSQVNTGKSIISNSTGNFNAGLNTFKVTTAYGSRNISFNIEDTDSNKTGLEKMAKAIISSNTGLTASVQTDLKAGTSYLRLASKKTGNSNGFALEDVSGNSVALSGAGNLTSKAQNANYTINGQSYSSEENTARINNGKVEVTFTKAENKDIKVYVGSDYEGIKSDIKDFVDSYNKALSFTSGNSLSFSGAARLSNELMAIVKSKKSSLEAIGVGMGDNGTLTVDDKKLDNAVKNNIAFVKDTVGGSNGLASKAYSKSLDVLSSPVEYAKPSDINKDYNSFYSFMSSSGRLASQQNAYRGLIVDTLL